MSVAISYDCVPFARVSSAAFPELRNQVLDSLSRFECAKSPFLECFARKDMTRHETHGNAKTYLLLTNYSHQPPDVAGFFTVGLQSLSFDKLNNSTKKKLSGNFSYDQAGAYLIAQLARSDRYTTEQLCGATILKEAFRIIASAKTFIGGRFLVVDFQEVIFQKLYEPHGFKRLYTANPPRSMPDSEFVTAGCLIKDF